MPPTSPPREAGRILGDHQIHDKMAFCPLGLAARSLLRNEKLMPTIYRAMKQTDDGLPAVGSGSSELGVRIPPNPNADIEVDDDGNVILNGNGMSVVENWRSLLPHLVPKRLKPIFPGATGSNKLACFRFGEGPFSPGSLNDRLSLNLKRHDVRVFCFRRNGKNGRLE
jgi:hypothetical protein